MMEDLFLQNVRRWGALGHKAHLRGGVAVGSCGSRGRAGGPRAGPGGGRGAGLGQGGAQPQGAQTVVELRPGFAGLL